jgi:hypothetical protein
MNTDFEQEKTEETENRADQILFLDIYAKSQQEDLASEEIEKLKGKIIK